MIKQVHIFKLVHNLFIYLFFIEFDGHFHCVFDH